MRGPTTARPGAMPGRVRAAGLHHVDARERTRSPGQHCNDAKDATVIADAARTVPRTLRSLELTDEIIAELTVLVGFDQDLAAEATRTSNRIRGLLTQFHPSLERVLAPRLDHQAVT